MMANLSVKIVLEYDSHGFLHKPLEWNSPRVFHVSVCLWATFLTDIFVNFLLKNVWIANNHGKQGYYLPLGQRASLFPIEYNTNNVSPQRKDWVGLLLAFLWQSDISLSIGFLSCHTHTHCVPHSPWSTSIPHQCGLVGGGQAG